MSSSSSGRAPTLEQIQHVANAALQSRAVQVTKLDGYKCSTYSLRISRGIFYILRCPSQTRLLSNEERHLEAEVAAIQALQGRSDQIHTRVIDYQTNKNRSGYLYHITGPFTGRTLSEIKKVVTPDKLAALEFSLGQYMNHLNSIAGPSFGYLYRAHLLPQTWSVVFSGLLESVLRDGEEALIKLPYKDIRRQVHRYRHCLDRVTTPRLVILDAASHGNIVIDESFGRVTGLLEYSTAMWGDPFLSDCCYHPTRDFIKGYGPSCDRSADAISRQYLYHIYHSVLSIVRKSYRPSEEQRVSVSSACEDLQMGLNQLDSR